MRLKRIVLAAALAAGLIAPFAFGALWDADTDAFAGVDTQGLDAVTLEVSKGDEVLARLLIRENEMGSVRLTRGGSTVGIVPEAISLRGDATRLAFYQLESSRDAATKNGTWVEDREVARGERVAVPAAALSRGEEPGFDVRLLSVRLADR